MSNIIEFKDFSFKYNNLSKATLNEINLSIKSGEKVLIAGPSGSGKSTLGHCLNGLIPSAHKGEITGEILLDGVNPSKKSIFDLSSHIGTILQDQDGQFVGLSVGEDVAFIEENRCTPLNEMKKDVFDSLGLVEMTAKIDDSPQELSGGEKQSVSLAGILINDANILLFDEPLANLDPVSGEKAMNLISDIHKKTNKTIIVIEHRIEDVLEVGFDRIIVINEGRIVANDNPSRIIANDDLKKNGLREPLYIEALKYSKSNQIEDLVIDFELNDSSREGIRNWNKDNSVDTSRSFEKLLEIEDLSFSYHDKRGVLDNISFNLGSGEILALLGNNGAGKSTLSKAITGMVKPEGTIKLLDETIDNWSIRKRGGSIGYVMQNPNHMITQETLIKEVEFGLNLRKIKNSREKAEEVLRVCGLHAFRNWPVTALSYGQKKRLSIASILALDPKVIILDEPTAGQDHKHYLEFMEFINILSKNGIGIILITHDMHLALEYADRGIVLSKGKIIADAKISQILTDEDVMERGNLKKTSLSKLALKSGVDPIELMETFINYEHREESTDE